jgi:hypothetical protein
MLLDIIGFYWILLDVTGYYWILLEITGYYWILLDITGYYWMLLDIIGCYWILLDVTGYYWMLLDITGYYWRLLDITGYYWILLAVYCRLKKRLLKTGLDFWTRATKTSKTERSCVFRDKMEGKQPIMETVEYKMLKWKGRALPKRTLTSSPEGTKRGGRA